MASEAAVKATVGRGGFISFEGGEGSGKSTQIKLLAERLAGVKLHTLVTREPGGSPGAEIIRHLVLSGMGKLLGPEAETLLFAAARDDHARTVIEPALNFVNPPVPEIPPLSRRVVELEMNVAAFSRMSPVQTAAPLELKAPPGLVELSVRFSLVTCMLLRNRLPVPFTTVPASAPAGVVVVPNAPSASTASWPSLIVVVPL